MKDPRYTLSVVPKHSAPSGPRPVVSIIYNTRLVVNSEKGKDTKGMNELQAIGYRSR